VWHTKKHLALKARENHGIRARTTSIPAEHPQHNCRLYRAFSATDVFNRIPRARRLTLGLKYSGASHLY